VPARTTQWGAVHPNARQCDDPDQKRRPLPQRSDADGSRGNGFLCRLRSFPLHGSARPFQIMKGLVEGGLLAYGEATVKVNRNGAAKMTLKYDRSVVRFTAFSGRLLVRYFP